MSSTLRVSLVVQANDLGCKPCSSGERGGDDWPTTHDLVDRSPVQVTTAGGAGSLFWRLPTPVVQVERVVASFATGSAGWLRLGGAEAVVLGGNTSPVFAGGETLELAIDGQASFTTTFLNTDNTLALAVRRINYAASSAVASLVDGRLVLTGAKSGDAGAQQGSRQFGLVNVVGGTALAQLGLSAGLTSGAGYDLPISPGVVVLQFPPGALPKRIEISGSVPSAKFTIAGKAALCRKQKRFSIAATSTP